MSFQQQLKTTKNLFLKKLIYDGYYRVLIMGITFTVFLFFQSYAELYNDINILMKG